MSKSVFDDLNKFDSVKPRALTPHPLFDNFGKSIDREFALKELNLDKNYRYILFFGFIRDYKGLDLLLEAFSDDWFRNKPIKILVAGEFYTDEEKYHKIIKKNKLGEHIELHTNFISNERVNLYFSAADIIAQPYKTATQSGVTQIGYHFNKPMLVTDVGGLSEIIPHEKVGYVVKPSPKAIAQSLINFFDKKRSEEFGKNILLEKKKFTWDKMVNTIKLVHQKILENDHTK